ncbi:MAG TPA: GspH/FimT family pseudopilin [Chthoniobacteraceae bacterium]|nr:GspH/FimT family pseudopilin [Chthoniobacteraceae bacterium]
MNKSADHRSHDAAAFTLIELILVMALLATIMAIAAPSLSHSLRDRNLRQEAARFVALTEYARSEAISRGLPMIVWVDAEEKRFGAEAKPGFDDDTQGTREFVLHEDIQFGPIERTTNTSASRDPTLIEFAPDGTLQTESIDTLSLTDRFNATALIQRTRDAWGYEVSKEVQ